MGAFLHWVKENDIGGSSFDAMMGVIRILTVSITSLQYETDKLIACTLV